MRWLQIDKSMNIIYNTSFYNDIRLMCSEETYQPSPGPFLEADAFAKHSLLGRILEAKASPSLYYCATISFVPSSFQDYNANMICKLDYDIPSMMMVSLTVFHSRLLSDRNSD